MSAPLFYLQIVDRRGVVAHLPGGGPLEADLIDLCVKQILTHPVGVFRTQAAVERAIREGIHEAILSLKQQTAHLVVT